MLTTVLLEFKNATTTQFINQYIDVDRSLLIYRNMNYIEYASFSLTDIKMIRKINDLNLISRYFIQITKFKQQILGRCNI